MGYYDFPHTRNYDTDLGYLIKRYFELNADFESLEKNFNDLKAWCIAQLNSEALKTLVANKLDEWLEDGTLASLINDPLLHITTYDTVVEMIAHSGLENGAKIYCTGADTINDGKGGHFRIRARLSTDIIDNYNLYLVDGSIKVAERIGDRNKSVYVTPEQYGAIGDGISDDTNAINQAIESGYPVLLSAGHYKISDSILNPKVLIGAGQRLSYIEMIDGSKPIIKFELGGSGLYIHNFCLTYKAEITENSNALFISDNALIGQSFFDGLYIDNVNSGIYSKGNIYSCTFSNLWINKYNNSGVYLDGIGSTGCVFSNIYTTNWLNYANRERNKGSFGFFVRGYTESIFQQINVEHTIVGSAMYFNTCDNIKIESLHLEGIIPSGNYTGLITANFSNLLIDNYTIVYSGSASDGYKDSDTTANSIYLLALLNISSIKCESIFLRNNSWNFATNKRVAYSNDSSDVKTLDVNKLYDANNLISGTIGFKNNLRIPQVKNDGSKLLYDRKNGTIVRYVDSDYSVLNIDDILYKGDKFIPNIPTSDNIFEWVVTESGHTNEKVLKAKGKLIQYNSQLFLTENDVITAGMRLKISDVIYIATTDPYSSSTYSEYPYAVTLDKNATSSVENADISLAPPTIIGLKCTL